MTNTPSHQFILMGLPSTGKTSFLAALWYMVDQQGVPCGLTLEKLDGDSKYLNGIRDAWLQYKPVARNVSLSEKPVAMILRDRNTGDIVQVNCPDLSGESFRLQWTDRQFTSQYDTDLRAASGGILFLHPDIDIKPFRIDMAAPLIEAASPETEDEEDTAASAEPNLPKEWPPESTCTQVQVVELLQFILGREYFRPVFKLAVVVSAWDLADKENATPSEWVTNHFPLLSQFLAANANVFETAYYGVSAQGGRYASSRFTSDDFTDATNLVDTLTKGAAPISAWLWSQFDPADQVSLQEPGQAVETLQSVLVRNLNAIIGKTSIYDTQRFKDARLRKETKEELSELLSKDPGIGEETLRLNRLLLEDAFPGLISRTRQYEKEAAELQNKELEQRVRLVGQTVQNAHDITEPFQWLMH